MTDHTTPTKLRGRLAIQGERLRQARQIALMLSAMVDVQRRRLVVLERENRQLCEAAGDGE